MLEEIRRPFFLVAVTAWLLVVLVEVGASFVLPVPKVTKADFMAAIQNDPSQRDAPPSPDDMDRMFAARTKDPPRPGYAITTLLAFDGLVFLGLFWMAAGLVISRRLVGRAQGIVSLVVALVALVAAIRGVIGLYTLLMVMLDLLLAVPFGTLAYLAIWGFFDTGPAATTLGILMFLKFATAVLLVLAHQEFPRNKRLVMVLALSVLLTLLIGFLHSFPPGILVSITDVIAALIALSVSISWAIVLLIGSIVATIKAIPPEKTSR